MANDKPTSPPPAAPAPACPACGSGNLWVDYTSLVSFTFNDGQLVRASQGGVLGGTPDVLICRDCDETSRHDEELWRAVDSAMSALPARVRDALTDGTTIWER